MKKTAKTFTLIVVVLFIAFVWTGYALFHGLFDRGNFEVEQAQWSPSKQLATVARRYDHEALSGDQYFVVIGDHPLSSAELKYSYYHDGVVFRASSSCLSVRWENEHELIVTCGDHSIKADQIAIAKNQVGDIGVIYENIPIGPGK
jgi:hypothetical protein